MHWVFGMSCQLSCPRIFKSGKDSGKDQCGEEEENDQSRCIGGLGCVVSGRMTRHTKSTNWPLSQPSLLFYVSFASDSGTRCAFSSSDIPAPRCAMAVEKAIAVDIGRDSSSD